MTPEQFLADFPPHVQALAHELRAIIKRAVPDVVEIVYPGWRLLGYKAVLPDRQAYFCYVAPSTEQVTLGFEYGVLLADPYHLLRGEGKQVRHIAVADPQNIVEMRLAYYVREAARLAALSREERTHLQMAREEELDLERRTKTVESDPERHDLSRDDHDGTRRT